MQLGFVGTGTMGAPMAGCLIDAGHQLTVYDIRSDATAALCGRGARAAENPCAVALQSEVVFTSLPGPREVELAALDAPVSGRPPMMTVMVGGDEAVFARYQPLLAAMAGSIFYVGEAGSGCI